MSSRDRTTSFVFGAWRVFELSLGEMLWSRRTIFMLLIAGSPVVLALVVRIVRSAGVVTWPEGLAPAGVFGMMVWVLFLRFIIPVLGVFYGTSLIADEVDDKTITYLFSRPVRRGAVLAGKFIAYLVCSTLVVSPSVMLVYFLVVPVQEIGASFVWLAADLGLTALGLAAYGSVFTLVGAFMRRPLVVGLVFAFVWEQLALAVPGYPRRLTVAYYLQGLVPHSMPTEGVVSVLQALTTDVPSVGTGLFWLLVVCVVCLTLAVRLVERHEYVLEQ